MKVNNKDKSKNANIPFSNEKEHFTIIQRLKSMITSCESIINACAKSKHDSDSEINERIAELGLVTAQLKQTYEKALYMTDNADVKNDSQKCMEYRNQMLMQSRGKYQKCVKEFKELDKAKLIDGGNFKALESLSDFRQKMNDDLEALAGKVRTAFESCQISSIVNFDTQTLAKGIERLHTALEAVSTYEGDIKNYAGSLNINFDEISDLKNRGYRVISSTQRTIDQFNKPGSIPENEYDDYCNSKFTIYREAMCSFANQWEEIKSSLNHEIESQLTSPNANMIFIDEIDMDDDDF